MSEQQKVFELTDSSLAKGSRSRLVNESSLQESTPLSEEQLSEVVSFEQQQSKQFGDLKIRRVL